jgi:hypothetical protein
MPFPMDDRRVTLFTREMYSDDFKYDTVHIIKRIMTEIANSFHNAQQEFQSKIIMFRTL